jgi:MraZ protein
VFSGTSQINLDDKGRLAIQVKYRGALMERSAGRLKVTAHVDPCLQIYPVPDWEPVAQTLREAPQLDPRVRQWHRLLVGCADDVDMDASGRVLIPPALRDMAGLGKTVVLVGMGKKFELWGKDAWDKTREAAMAELAAGPLPPALEGFSF